MALAIPSAARFLMAARAARSVGQGTLVVDFALYLHVLHWSASAIGMLFFTSLLLGAIATLLVGPASDRYGAKTFLIGYELLQILAAVLAASTAATPVLWLAAILGGFGRGGNGSAGPFAPAEQSWLSRSIPHGMWGKIFHLNTALGLFGMGAGALLAAFTPFLSRRLSLTQAGAYRILFAAVLVGALLCLVFLYAAKEPPSAKTPRTFRPEDHAQEPAGDGHARAGYWKPLLVFAGINSLNGFGIGMVGPLMSYWLHLRFGVGPAAIGPGMAVAFFSAAFMSIYGIRLIRQFGLAGTVLRLRLAGILLLLGIPFAPTFWLAMVLFVLRSAMNQGSTGSRQALFLGLVDSRHRGLAATVNSLSIQLPRAAGPVLASLFYEAGLLAWPFLIAVSLQGLYLLFFIRFFRNASGSTTG